jgi:hypothetical protein
MTTQTRAGAAAIQARANPAMMQSLYRGDPCQQDQSTFCPLQNRANEPNGSLGKIYGLTRRHYWRIEVIENRANEPNGSLGKICRPSFR